MEKKNQDALIATFLSGLEAGEKKALEAIAGTIEFRGSRGEAEFLKLDTESTYGRGFMSGYIETIHAKYKHGVPCDLNGFIIQGVV